MWTGRKRSTQGSSARTPAGARLEALEAQQGIEPDDLAREQAQLLRRARQLAVLVAVEAVGDEQQRGVGAEQAARPVPVEVVEARRDPRAALPVLHLRARQLEREVGVAVAQRRA